ncbi:MULTISPECIES: DUF2989 domain-containing protein [unclassified Agarivorans]|uniref:DUF2989 domain-containing protein n=1 Tax=unclassified Agarivorans TaxID=2636026 RepID=UPI003D7D8880
MKLTGRFLCLLLPLALSACDLRFNIFNFGSLSAKKVCNNNPELCEDLNQDGWCKKERSAVILSRYNESKEPNDPHKYQLIKDYKDYNACIELAASIEPRYDKSRKTKRVVGMLTSIEELARLEAETTNSDYPFLLMYHWKQLRDKQAKQRFLALEGSDALKSPELQWTLAMYYNGKNAKKTITILENTFKLFPEDETIPAKYAEAIVSQYMVLKDYNNAYIWAQIASQFDDHIQQDYSGLNYQLNLTEQQQEKLEEQAETIAEQIINRQYRL